MAKNTRNDPYRRFNFLLEIDGVTKAGFSEVSGLTTETTVIEYREGNERATTRKIPGLTKYSNIVLKRGITRDRSLWDWRKTVIAGATLRTSGRKQAGSRPLEFPRSLAVQMGRPVRSTPNRARWRLKLWNSPTKDLNWLN